MTSFCAKKGDNRILLYPIPNSEWMHTEIDREKGAMQAGYSWSVSLQRHLIRFALAVQLFKGSMATL